MPQLLVQAQQVPPSHCVHGATTPAPQSPQVSVLCLARGAPQEC